MNPPSIVSAARILWRPMARKAAASTPSVQIQLPIPGEASAFGWHFLARSETSAPPAAIRNWRPGDRVTLRYSSGPRKIKEVLERLKVTGSDRQQWPVVAWEGQILWMQGAELAPHPGILITAQKGKTVPEK